MIAIHFFIGMVEPAFSVHWAPIGYFYSMSLHVQQGKWFTSNIPYHLNHLSFLSLKRWLLFLTSIRPCSIKAFKPKIYLICCFLWCKFDLGWCCRMCATTQSSLNLNGYNRTYKKVSRSWLKRNTWVQTYSACTWAKAVAIACSFSSGPILTPSARIISTSLTPVKLKTVCKKPSWKSAGLFAP